MPFRHSVSKLSSFILLIGVQVGVPIAVLICLAAFIVAGVLMTRHRARYEICDIYPAIKKYDESLDSCGLCSSSLDNIR